MALRQEQTSVLIVGAGPVGLSLGIGLARAGVKVIVIEKNSSTSEHSKAPAIWPRTLEVFQSLGVFDAIHAKGFHLPAFQIWSADHDKPLLSLSLEGLKDITPWPELQILAQNETENLLVQDLKRYPYAELRFAHRLDTFNEHHQKVDAVIKSDQETYKIQSDFLVGCDGAHSSVRDILGMRLKGHTYSTQVALADVKIPALNEVPWPWPRVTLKNGLAIGIRLDQELWRIILPLEKGATKLTSISDEVIAQRVKDLWGGFRYENVWRSVFHLHQRHSPSFRSGRILLAGDSAHLNSPAGGQGMNVGIQDAHNLAWKLGLSLEPNFHWEQLLDSFEEERRQVVTESVEKYTDLLTRLVVLQGNQTRYLFYLAARAALGLPVTRRKVLERMAMLDHCYKSSPLLSGECKYEGHLITHVPLKTCTNQWISTYELISPKAALLLVERSRIRRTWDRHQVESLFPASLLKWLDIYHVMRNEPELRYELQDRGNQLSKRFLSHQSGAILVRPDGFIGACLKQSQKNGLLLRVQVALGHLPISP